jgi:hypothetical protein
MRPALLAFALLLTACAGEAPAVTADAPADRALPAHPGPCGQRAAVLNHLALQYGERRVARGLSDSGAILEIVASDDGRTWTALLTFPGGRAGEPALACLLATGSHFELAPPGRPS